ncbi:MAG: hypothetical protein WCT37_04120 [Patescibacteria group bacterium]|jgi:hypothetical protein
MSTDFYSISIPAICRLRNPGDQKNYLHRGQEINLSLRRGSLLPLTTKDGQIKIDENTERYDQLSETWVKVAI